jgi:hypothetical protein
VAGGQATSRLSFLADTWWYGFTRRFDDARFESLARQRAGEGFTAVQVVAGVPPEVGPAHPEAASAVGPAWSPEGHVNRAYLDLVRHRSERLLGHGLTPVIYGGWGHQIAWLGTQRMTAWWEQLVRTLDDLPVVYCLCGEIDLWIEAPDRLLPDRSTDDLAREAPAESPVSWAKERLRRHLPAGVRRGWRALVRRTDDAVSPAARERRQAWTAVLRVVAERTAQPILVHPLPGRGGRSTVDAPDLLAAETVQTGHDEATRDDLWRLPLQHHVAHPEQPFVNLEPWYDGIRDSFRGADQVYAYAASMLAGASAHAYGAHGIWNAGDGKFLAHWGTQTFDEARVSPAGAAVGALHRQFVSGGWAEGRPEVVLDRGRLTAIRRVLPHRTLHYHPGGATLVAS